MNRTRLDDDEKLTVSTVAFGGNMNLPRNTFELGWWTGATTLASAGRVIVIDGFG